MSDVLSLSNPTFKSFAFYGTTTIAKMISMSLATSICRNKRSAFINPEDVSLGWRKRLNLSVVQNDEAVERVRRNHLNDLENIPAFVLLGTFYLFTEPSATTAKWHFRVFFLARLLHTLSYQLGLQPARSIFFATSMGVNISMATQILMSAVGGL